MDPSDPGALSCCHCGAGGLVADSEARVRLPRRPRPRNRAAGSSRSPRPAQPPRPAANLALAPGPANQRAPTVPLVHRRRLYAVSSSK
jgi:hypothetical protein